MEGSSYLGQPLPFSLTTLIWIEVLVVGYIEFQRNAELDPEKRIYPGGYFDPLGLAADPAKLDTLKLAEIKHSSRHDRIPHLFTSGGLYWQRPHQLPRYF